MRFDLPDHKIFTHEMIIPIRWGDMDMMGHVNNAVYFRYLEIIRIDWLRSLGGAPDPADQGPVIVNAFCTFMKQLSFPGDILARQYVANPGRSSFDAFATLELVGEPGVIYAEGGAKIVWVDSKAKKSVPLPDRLRQKLSQLEPL